MIKKGYPREFSTGVTVASSTMGMIIPPSIPMLMYSMVSGASGGKLFLAGVIPGLLVGVTQLVYTYIVSKKRHYPQEKGMLPLRETLSIAKDGLLAVLMPFIIIVSVSAGIATASESAGIALLYAMLLGFFVYKELRVKAVIQSLKKTAVMTSSIMIIGGFTMIFTWVLAIEQVPVAIASFLLDSNIPFWLILLLLDLLILFLGTFLDVVPCILLIAPILLPVMRTLGMDELQFGIIMIVGLAIGLVTPPVGMCLNVGSKISGLSILEIFKDSLPFLVCNVLVLLLVTFVPSSACCFPRFYNRTHYPDNQEKESP
jgi:tripartite ATP-independent transporter DctM subunit